MAPSEPRPVAILPFHFDTAGVVTTIGRGIVALLCVLAAGVLYSVIVSRRMATAAGLLVIGAGVLWLGRVMVRNLEGTRGVITRDAVVVQPGGFWGMTMAGPAGTFPLRQFKAVRVERIMPGADMQSRGHERVLLVGHEGTPDIMIVRADLDAGRAFGGELAAALKLPLEERPAPY
jgi:hypothetical protein